MTSAKLVENKKKNIDLVISPVKDNDIVTEASIKELIKTSEYGVLKVIAANIKNALAELNSVLKNLQANQKGREITYQVLERLDASISISIDSDEMGCTAEIMTALGGKHLSAKAILNAAQASGISKGFSKEELIRLAQTAAREPPGTIVKSQIARGKNPINGRDSQIKPLVESAQTRILKPKERDDGSVDMRDLGDIVCVKVGEPLIQKIPFTLGKAGYTVTGTPLEPTPGEDVDLKVGDGTVISPKNKNVLVSAKVGLPRIIENGMEVDEVYQIKNVDISTGHVRFEGSVIIDGDVCEGMEVSATGDISIGGFVESASLEAGGDITIGSGIIGKKHEAEGAQIHDVEMSVNINAGGNVFAKYCQYAHIECHDIRIENQLMHSILEVEGRVWVGTEEKANGKLIAGYIKACESVHAGIVGATAGAITIVNFEQRIQEYREEIDKLDEQIKAENSKTNELKSAVNKLKKLPKDKAQPDMLKKVVSTYTHHAKQLGALLNNKQDIDNLIQDYMTKVYVEATEKLYQSVEMIVGDFNERSKREYGPSRMIYKERKVHIDPIVHSTP